MERTHRAGREGADAGERERLLGEQKGLRDELRRLQRGLGGGTGDGEGSGSNPLDEAGEAMDEAGGALDRGEGEEAVDAQGRALDGLRRGAREMAEAEGDEQPGGEIDPLGRRRNGAADGGRVGIPGEIDVERARRILDDIRRRLGDPGRPSGERDYLDRLLDLDR